MPYVRPVRLLQQTRALHLLIVAGDLDVGLLVMGAIIGALGV